MSGLWLLVLLATWAFAGWMMFRAWRCWKPKAFKQKVAHITVGVLLFSVWFGGGFWEVAGKKMYWDAKVRELCAVDGGVRVYETVQVPAEVFDQYGNVQILSETQAGPRDSYFYKRGRKTLRIDNPKIYRTHYLIVRRSDGKILGESVHYSRSGGDLPGPWHPSSYICPPISKEHIGIEKQIFEKEGKINEHH